MTAKPENPPAFACAAENGYQQGMSLRDYFAAKALAADISTSTPGAAYDIHAAASWAYSVADAMLSERSKTDGK